MRLIDADALVDDITAASDNAGMGAVIARTLIRYVKRAPTIDAVPVVHGRWIWNETGKPDWEQFYTCSNCGDREYWESHFCPNCGAKMDLEVDCDG